MKIDLVYLWVNGTDPQWMVKKNQYLSANKQDDVEIIGDCRFVQYDELKYSLRSVEKNAPWINHIYIVTDSQIPSWLDTSSSKITIVDHKDIISSDYLPLFNSIVIELAIHKIKGLSEHFLYGNDDMFFGRRVEPSFFFHPNGEPVIRLCKMKVKGKKGNYRKVIYRMQCEAAKRYGKFFKYAPHHNIDSYRCSDCQKAYDDFKEQVATSFTHRFRNDNDVQRIIVSYRLLAHTDKKPVIMGRYNGSKNIFDTIVRFFKKEYITDSRCFPTHIPNIEDKIARYNPALFTLNDSSEANNSHRVAVVALLEKLFPTKSKFEL